MKKDSSHVQFTNLTNTFLKTIFDVLISQIVPSSSTVTDVPSGTITYAAPADIVALLKGN